MRAHLKAAMTLQHYASKGTKVTSQSQVGSAAAVSGDWFMLDSYAGSCSGANYGNYATKMNYCAENDEGSSPSIFSIYTCTEDSSSGAVVLSQTTYTDSACTTGATSQADVTYSTSCTGDVAARCRDVNEYDATMSEFSGGLTMSAYDTSSSCNSAEMSGLYGYAGYQGCDGNGILYGSDSIAAYFTDDCSGDAVISLSYDDFLPAQCSIGLVDDDYYYDDGDYDDGPIYDNVYLSFSYSGDDDDVCFHVDSKIDYKGVEYTYEELKAGKEPECSVPHSPSSKGVIISTSCDKTVRVTDTHLLATTKGFQLAYSLKAGDVLFGDYGSEMCTVKSVEKEQTTQQYFGLNCVHSEVLASGLRASTFGDFHTLPSWYMTYVGGMIGTETASSLGEYVAEWYFKK
jgi:hypothetical protein